MLRRSSLAVVQLLMVPATLVAQETSFRVGQVQAAPGERVSGFLDVAAGVDSGTRIPITVIHGASAGPVLALIAGTHGLEVAPILALHRVRRDVDPTTLRGTVILVHIPNLPSYTKRTVYYNPWDWKNLNRGYPGRPDGTVTERIAHAITTEVIARADYLVGMLFNALDVIDIFYQARTLSKYVVQARAIAFLFFSVVRVGLIFGEFSVVWFAWVTTLDLALSAALMLWIYRRREGKTSGWVWQTETAKALLRDGWPLVASSLFIIIHTRIDQVMIGQMLGEVHVGIYSAAIRISEAWLFVPALIVQTLMPYFVQLRELSPVRYQQRLMHLYNAMFWTGATAGILTMILGAQAITFLFGEAYSGAYAPLVLTIWTGIFIAQAVARGVWMIHDRAYPIDSQCASQAIETLADFSDYDPDSLGLAANVADWTIDHMQDPRGFFYYRRYPLGLKAKTPMLHWAQATTYRALALLLSKLELPRMGSMIRS